MVDIAVLPATLEHADHIGRHLRAIDALELALVRPDNTPHQSVLNSLTASTWAEAVLVDAQPAIIYGVVPSSVPGVAIPWMVATEAIHRISRAFVKGSAEKVACMHTAGAFLMNRVHHDNTLSIRWLKWLGFKVEDTPCGPNGAFRDFWRMAQ